MKNYRNKEVILVDCTTGKQVQIGDTITTFRGNKEIAKFFQPPHKFSSSGKVNNYYASVYNCEYKEI